MDFTMIKRVVALVNEAGFAGRDAMGSEDTGALPCGFWRERGIVECA